jgi:hypothetical protein
MEVMSLMGFACKRRPITERQYFGLLAEPLLLIHVKRSGQEKRAPACADSQIRFSSKAG